MKTTTAIALGTIFGATTLLLFSCKSEEVTESHQTETASDLQSYLLTEAPGETVSVASLFDNPQPGDEVTVSGKVMGRENIFVDNRAMLVLGDPEKITSCDLRPADSCETPWDVCCDDKELVKKSVATIQIVDDSGRPLPTGLKGLGGISELSELIVQGTIAEGSSPENIVVNASGIFVQKP